METAFKIGQLVWSKVTNGNLTKDRQYQVTDLHARVTAFGTFITYELWDAIEMRGLSTSNGHLLLQADATPELVDDVEETTPIPAETCRQVVEGRLR